MKIVYNISISYSLINLWKENDMKIFDKILEKHTKINNYKRQSYMINEDIEIIISQEGSKVIMRGFNHKTDRFINFSTKKYKKLMDGFKSASTDLYSDGNHFYYIK